MLLTKKLIVSIICKKSFQHWLNKLFLLSMTGMNYGNANTLEIKQTGELGVMKYISLKTKDRKEAFTFFDVGANAGEYSLNFAAVFKDRDYKIFAFEPCRGTFEIYQKNLSNFPQVTSLNFGLGSKEENSDIFYSFQGSGATTLYNEAIEHSADASSIKETIQLKKLDDFCAAHNIQVIDFIKIDVEGHELQVLKGGEKMLREKKIKFIQFEFGPFHIYSKTFFKDFWNLLTPDYKIYRVLTDGLFQIPFYNENLEIFRTSNFLAQLI